MKKISIELMKEAIKLSTNWNNTCFIVLNLNGTLDAIVYNKYKWENPKREYIAHVNDNDGFVIKAKYIDQYEFEIPLK